MAERASRSIGRGRRIGRELLARRRETAAGCVSREPGFGFAGRRGRGGDFELRRKRWRGRAGGGSERWSTMCCAMSRWTRRAMSIERMVRLNARAIGATDAESDAARAAVAAALAHPLIVRCAAGRAVLSRISGDSAPG